MHYDFRLEIAGVLKSWAIPKGPSMDPAVKRLAVEVEEHPLDYADFEGVIEENQYGAGPVLVWDTGWFEPLDEDRTGQRGLATGKMRGRSREWLLIKQADQEALPGHDVIADAATSVLTGRRIEDRARETGQEGEGS